MPFCAAARTKRTTMKEKISRTKLCATLHATTNGVATRIAKRRPKLKNQPTLNG